MKLSLSRNGRCHCQHRGISKNFSFNRIHRVLNCVLEFGYSPSTTISLYRTDTDPLLVEPGVGLVVM